MTTDINIKGVIFKLTSHAKHRMAKRGVSVEDLIEAIETPRSIKKMTLVGRKPQRIGVLGRNKVTIIYEEVSKIIITVYNYRTEYYKNKNKQRKNKDKLNLKRRLGNRLKS